MKDEGVAFLLALPIAAPFGTIHSKAVTSRTTGIFPSAQMGRAMLRLRDTQMFKGAHHLFNIAGSKDS